MSFVFKEFGLFFSQSRGIILGFALGLFQGWWPGQCRNLAPRHTCAGSGASNSVSWDPWVSARSKQKCLGSEIHRENLAMHGASWLVTNVVNWAREVTCARQRATCTESPSVLEGLFRPRVGCRWVVVNTWKMTRALCPFSRMERNTYDWSRKVLSPSGGALPWRRGGQPTQATFLPLGHSRSSPRCHQGQWQWNRAQKIYANFFFFTSFWHLFCGIFGIFYMEKRKILIKRNVKFCHHSRKVIVFCLTVIILSNWKFFSIWKDYVKMLFLHGSVFLHLTFHL